MAPVRLLEKGLEILEGSVNGVDGVIVCNVITIVLERRRIKWQQPNRGNSKLLQIIELFGEPAEIADAIRIAVMKGTDVRFIDDGIFIPKRVAAQLTDA